MGERRGGGYGVSDAVRGGDGWADARAKSVTGSTCREGDRIGGERRGGNSVVLGGFGVGLLGGQDSVSLVRPAVG